MKTLKISLPVIFFITALISDIGLISAQTPPTAKEAVIKNLIDSQRYVFYAQSLTPMSGRQRILTSDYTVDVSKDTIICDLPFFGRAYSAPLNASEGGIKFTSINFDYKLNVRKKGDWDIIIKPKDAPDVQFLSFTVFKNGAASLLVNSTNRQAITFNGYIKEIRNK